MSSFFSRHHGLKLSRNELERDALPELVALLSELLVVRMLFVSGSGDDRECALLRLMDPTPESASPESP